VERCLATQTQCFERGAELAGHRWPAYRALNLTRNGFLFDDYKFLPLFGACDLSHYGATAIATLIDELAAYSKERYGSSPR
jgi:hypothetical protein